jgi:hypothetical protein
LNFQMVLNFSSYAVRHALCLMLRNAQHESLFYCNRNELVVVFLGYGQEYKIYGNISD